ncbi:hypothetical protein NP511_06610 [Natrinema thermotolerans]|uniref:Uncharacterized protein n=1 Tax=Natrinema thermotolerans TaxID=121872 RepID=A0AAF0T7B5_9EURY|nr:hypothetical protein [Natrinema thermotolerans]WMT09304.1 hypothetical protein NP511_06610 [Natrinema thermotolerans]
MDDDPYGDREPTRPSVASVPRTRLDAAREARQRSGRNRLARRG